MGFIEVDFSCLLFEANGNIIQKVKHELPNCVEAEVSAESAPINYLALVQVTINFALFSTAIIDILSDMLLSRLALYSL